MPLQNSMPQHGSSSLSSRCLAPLQLSALACPQLAHACLQDEEDLYLCELAGVEDLSQAVKLQAVINTSTSTVSHLGAKLPSLQVSCMLYTQPQHVCSTSQTVKSPTEQIGWVPTAWPAGR